MIPVHVNPSLSAALIIAMIIIDYVRKYNTDPVQRRLYLAVLVSAMTAVITDVFERLIDGIPGVPVTYALYGSLSIFLIAQNCTYYLTFVFIDYFAFRNAKRAGKILKILAFFLGLYILALGFNLSRRFFFSISADNHYTPGKFYLLRLIISYFPLVLCFSDIAFSAKHFTLSRVYSIIFFGILVASGSVADILLRSSNLMWPCFAAAMLYFYFFIVQSDSKLDSLTGLGNRFSFNEFIEKLSRSSARESYSIVMIDMDHFKEINDTLGHLEGDNALRDMVSIIKSCIRESDLAVRYGGDEFVLAVRAEYDVTKLIERIKTAMEHQNNNAHRPYKLRMSYGWDVFTPGGNRSIKEFLSHVDSLMYRDKMENRRKERLAAESAQREKHNV
jgi:diguanylate cyclase (GGDEF)-like protein